MPENLTHIEHIRKRVGMYFGGSDKNALHRVLWIFIEQLTDRADEGLCSHLIIKLLPHNEIEMTAEGLYLSGEGDSFDIETALAKMDNSPTKSEGSAGGYRYHFESINAVCSTMVVETIWNDFCWQQSFIEGISILSTIPSRPREDSELVATTFRFTLDFTILLPNEIEFELLKKRCEELTYLLPNRKISLYDFCTEPTLSKTYQSVENLAVWVDELAKDTRKLHDTMYGKKRFSLEDGVSVDIEYAFVFTDSSITIEKTFANRELTPRGPHLWGMRSALVGIFEQLVWDQERELTWQDVRTGFIGCISLFHPKLSFTGASKQQVDNPELFGWLAEWIYSDCYQKGYWFFDEVVDRIKPVFFDDDDDE